VNGWQNARRITASPKQDRDAEGWSNMGSAHPSGFLTVLADGSVRSIPYETLTTVLSQLWRKADGAGRSGDL
jgi:hypothetical protein